MSMTEYFVQYRAVECVCYENNIKADFILSLKSNTKNINMMICILKSYIKLTKFYVQNLLIIFK